MHCGGEEPSHVYLCFLISSTDWTNVVKQPWSVVCHLSNHPGYTSPAPSPLTSMPLVCSRNPSSSFPCLHLPTLKLIYHMLHGVKLKHWGHSAKHVGTRHGFTGRGGEAPCTRSSTRQRIRRVSLASPKWWNHYSSSITLLVYIGHDLCHIT